MTKLYNTYCNLIYIYKDGRWLVIQGGKQMQIVIEIPKKMYEQFKIVQIFPTDKIIANGTPLPEHHGRLIDADVLVDGMDARATAS